MFKILIKETSDVYICCHKDHLFNFTKIYLTDEEWYNLYTLGNLTKDDLTLVSKEINFHELDIVESYLTHSELIKE